MALMVLFTLPLHYINFAYFRKLIRKDSMQIQEQ